MTFPTERFSGLETPFYYYDTALLSSTLQAIRTAIHEHPAFHVHYAIKANANPRILRLIAEGGDFGADCVSGGEIEAATAAGFHATDVVFAGVGKSDREIRLALSKGIDSFNVESLPELEVINELALECGKKARVCFRINPNVDAHTHAKITTGLNENKFGIAMDDLLTAVRHAEGLKGVQYVGLHFHIGSQILDFTVYEHLCQRINNLQDTLEHEGITTSIINVGGGLGIDYANPDKAPIPAFADYFNVFATHLKLRDGQRVYFELGRSVVAQCGTLVARTLYVKHGHSRKFLIVDAGFTELIRPALYDAHHFTENISAEARHETETDTYDVVGPICESSDVFSKDERLPLSRRGDFIAFRSAGAYGEVMASTYNCRHLPESYFNDTL